MSDQEWLCDRCGSEIYDTQDRGLSLYGYRAEEGEWSICRVCKYMLHQFMEGHDAVDREVAAHKVTEKQPSLEDVFCPDCGSKTLLSSDKIVSHIYEGHIKCGTCGSAFSKSEVEKLKEQV